MTEKQMRDVCSSVLLFSLLCLLLLAHVLPTLSAQGGEWIPKAPTPSQGAYGEAVVGSAEHLYIIRGHATGSCHYWRYNQTADAWTTILEWSPQNDMSFDPIPRPKSGTALTWDHGNYIYALLGAAYADSNRTFFYRYSIPANSWSRLADTPHPQGAGNAIVWSGFDNFIYAMLGSAEHAAAFARYNPSANSWETLSFNPIDWTDTDDGASLAWTGGEYLFALRGEWEETTPHADFARYHISTATWETMSPIPVSGGVGDGASLLWVGSWLLEYSNQVFALAGNNATETPGYGFYSYSVSSNTWTELPRLPYPVGDYVGNRLGFAGGHIYYWQGTPSTWSGGGTAFYMFNFQATTTTTQQQTTTTVTTSQTTTSSATTQTSVTTTSQITSTTIVLTTTSSYVTQTSVTTTATAHTTEQLIATPGAGLAFAVIGIGAGVAAVGAGVAFAASGQPGSRVFAYGGYYYCRKHGVPVLLVNGRLWCPVEGNYLRS